jgi:RNA-directed DNA polymerase
MANVSAEAWRRRGAGHVAEYAHTLGRVDASVATSSTPFGPKTLDKLSDAVDYEDLSALLGLSARKLGYFLHKVPIKNQYTKFEIRKKSGSIRVIHAPEKNLKILQKSMSAKLQELRTFKSCINGFVPGRSIITNAETHVGQRFILNLDLEDFFGSINFGRVYGMLRNRPYSLTNKVAAAIAKATTLENKLPQGAPTSPILSNLICAKMDSELLKLARKHSCKFSRYADDLTFSTHRKFFPLARLVANDDLTSEIVLSLELTAIIERNGFKINSSKTRLYTNSVRQEVTGLTVNKRTNIKRKFVRQTRAMLHDWNKNGLNLAQKKYEEKYDGKVDLSEVIQGRIAFIGQVRGKNDPIFKKLANKFNTTSKLTNGRKIKTELSPIEIAQQATWVIEGDGKSQGTAFFVEGIGVVTCEHCVSDKPYIYHRDWPGKTFPIEPLLLDKNRDLAVFKVPLALSSVKGIAMASKPANPGSSLILLGYPNHEMRKPVRLENGRLLRQFNKMAVAYIEITPKIIEGNSGGPVLNDQAALVGIAAQGINSDTELHQAEFNAIAAFELTKSLRDHAKTVAPK